MDDDGGRRGPDRWPHGRVDRAGWRAAVLGRRRPGEPDRHLAVYGFADAVGHRRGAGPEGGRGQLLAAGPYVAVESVRDLVGQHRPETTLLGIGLTISSLLLMPALGIAKQRLGARLASSATAGEGAQNLLCAYLAAAVLAGLVGNSLWGWWWLDPLAGLAVAAAAVREGLHVWRGENCCAVRPAMVDQLCVCGPGCTDAC